MQAPAEHAESYYAASRRDDREFPRLEGTHRCDVAVVGAGFTGVSAALYLAERGYDVALIEANRVGWGASGRNGGQLIDGFADPAKFAKRYGKAAADGVYRMGLECRDIVVQRIEQYGIDCDLRFGYLDVALRKADLREFGERLESMRRLEYPHAVAIVPREALCQHVGSERYLGGLVNYGNGHLHPLDLCVGEARAAAVLGAAIFEQSPVLRVRHGRAPRVETQHGEIFASKVVLAGNAYLGRVEPRLHGRTIVAGSYMIATEPLQESLASELLPSDMACCDQRTALDYFRLSADRRLLFGGLCNYSGRVPASVRAALRPKMLAVFPQLRHTAIDFEWGGNIAISVRRIPQFGRIEGNTYYAQGYSGHGLAPTHLAGKMLADIVGGDSEQFDLFSKIKHLYLPGGRWFGNPALALGMLYYRLRELL